MQDESLSSVVGPWWGDVWACDHLWALADDGDADAQDEIGCAAEALQTDSGENVALCDSCAASPQSVPLTLRHIKFAWTDDDLDRHRIVESRPGRGQWEFRVPTWVIIN